MDNETAATVPDGFVQFPGRDGFGMLCGPFWMKAEGEILVGGFRVEERHCNPAGICHGGMLATFCDLLLAVGAQFRGHLPTLILPTINLSLDYLAPTPKGAWVEVRPEVSKVTRGMVFASGTATVDGDPVVRAHGIFKIPSADSPLGGAARRNTGARLRALLQPGDAAG